MLDVGIDYHHDKLSASVTGKGIFHREGKYGISPVSEYKNYWVWDTAVNYQITPQAQLYVRLNNIFNQFYSDASTTGIPGASYWYSAPGRNYEAGVNFRF
jgi:outer membrane receptor protein involved in Fe transport